MSFDFVNFLAIISLVGIVVIFYKMVADYLSVRNRINAVDTKIDAIDEYNKILNATYWLEHERQRNQGEHFDDETIYLNRAQTIRTKTSFFSFVNE